MFSKISAISAIAKKPAFAGTFIVTVGTFIGSIFAYLLQVILGRKLSIENFGVFNTLLSFSTLLGLLSGALNSAIVKKVASLTAKKDFHAITRLFFSLSLFAMVLGAFLFLPIYFLSDHVGNFLNISEKTVIVTFGVYMALTLISSLPNAYLQGLCRFKALAFYLVASGFLRLTIPSGIVFLGYSVDAVFLGMGVVVIFSYLLSLLLLRKNFQKEGETCLIDHYKGLAAFVGPMLFLRVGLTMLNSTDVILVKHFFTPEIAGIYSGLVTVGKVLLFGAGSVATVMFPQIASVFAAGKSPKKALRGFLVVQVFLVAAGGLVFILTPRLITVLMFGQKYLPAVPYLPKFSVFIAFYVLISFFVMFFAAVEKYFPILFLILGAVLQVVLLTVFHASLAQVVNINLFVAGGVLLFLLICYRKFKVSEII